MCVWQRLAGLAGSASRCCWTRYLAARSTLEIWRRRSTQRDFFLYVFFFHICVHVYAWGDLSPPSGLWRLAFLLVRVTHADEPRVLRSFAAATLSRGAERLETLVWLCRGACAASTRTSWGHTGPVPSVFTLCWGWVCTSCSGIVCLLLHVHCFHFS